MISCVKTPKCHNSILIEQNSKIILYKTCLKRLIIINFLIKINYSTEPSNSGNSLLISRGVLKSGYVRVHCIIQEPIINLCESLAL